MRSAQGSARAGDATPPHATTCCDQWTSKTSCNSTTPSQPTEQNETRAMQNEQAEGGSDETTTRVAEPVRRCSP